LIPHSRPELKESDFGYIRRILKSRQVAVGPCARQLEDSFRRVVANRYAVSTSSGTAALHLALLALGVKAGDDVLAPSYACAAVAHAIRQTGAQPRWVDIDAKSLNLSSDSVRARRTARSKAIVVTHTLGFPTPMKGLLSLGLPVVEDCAAALGARTGDRPAGSSGQCSTFSFYATKVICAGEGGMVCTNSASTFGLLKEMNRPDERRDGQLCYNYKLSDLAAGLALSQLRQLPAFLARRRKIAQRYREAFSDCPVRIQEPAPGTETNHYRFLIRTPAARAVMAGARKQGVMCDRPVFEPLHRRFGREPGYHFPNTEALYREMVSVPIYPALTDREVDRVIRVLRAVLKNGEHR